jgi:hypothetical protein
MKYLAIMDRAMVWIEKNQDELQLILRRGSDFARVSIDHTAAFAVEYEMSPYMIPTLAEAWGFHELLSQFPAVIKVQEQISSQKPKKEPIVPSETVANIKPCVGQVIRDLLLWAKLYRGVQGLKVEADPNLVEVFRANMPSRSG